MSAAFVCGKLITVNILGLDQYLVLATSFLLFTAFMGVGMQVTNIPSIQKAKESAREVFAIIDEPSSLDVRATTQDTITDIGRGRIQFKKVCFQYPSRSAKVLEDLDMTIPAGSKIALVGHSGSGKSTITNLLLRFYDIQSGKILLDGERLEDYAARSLRWQTGYVMQEPILFNKSIKENILYGKLDATDEEVYKAALKANAIGFIEADQVDLTPEQQRAQTDQQLTEKLDQLQHGMDVSSLRARSEGYGARQRELLLEVLSNSDDAFEALMRSNLEKFLDFFDTNGTVSGMKWDDLVVRFEWVLELDRI